jgi:hypothetical protein
MPANFPNSICFHEHIGFPTTRNASANYWLFGFVLAAYLFGDFHRCSAWAQEPTAAGNRLELPLSDGSQAHAGSDIAFASADGHGQTGSLLLGPTGQNISNVAFAQPNAPAGAPPQPSYRAAGETEQVPTPKYLDPGNEQLSVDQQL